MYNSKYENFHVTPYTTFTRWKLEDFEKVVEYEDLTTFLDEFWESFSGFSVEFDMILCAIDCIEDGESYFVHNVYMHELNKCKMFNFSANDILCTERLSVLAKSVAKVLDTWKEKNTNNDVTQYLRDKDSSFSIALAYMKSMYQQKLSDGSYVDKARIAKVRNMLDLYDEQHGIDVEATFTVADRSILYDALDALESRCIF